jgi:hypothetical protein
LDRANAIETIQQSCPRSLFDRILFLIEQTSPSAPAALAKSAAAMTTVDLVPGKSAFFIKTAAK